MGYAYDGFWHPADTLKERTALEAAYQTGTRPWMLWDPERAERTPPPGGAVRESARTPGSQPGRSSEGSAAAHAELPICSWLPSPSTVPVDRKRGGRHNLSESGRWVAEASRR